MAQNPDNHSQNCRTCPARVGQPCVTRYGQPADRVHWGRGSYVVRKPYRRAASAPQSTRVAHIPWYRRVEPAQVAEYERRRFGD